MSEQKKWDLKYCRGCVHLCFTEVDQDVYKNVCSRLDSAMFDGESTDGRFCEYREIKYKKEK